MVRLTNILSYGIDNTIYIATIINEGVTIGQGLETFITPNQYFSARLDEHLVHFNAKSTARSQYTTGSNYGAIRTGMSDYFRIAYKNEVKLCRT